MQYINLTLMFKTLQIKKIVKEEKADMKFRK